jgi:hypothetical protein
VPFVSSTEEEVAAATAFHEAAHAAGVPTPEVRRTEDGSVFAPFNGGQARLYEWVDLRPPDRLLDPALVGAVVAAIHRVPTPDTDLGALDPFFCEPVGAERWDHVLDQLTHGGSAVREPDWLTCGTSWLRWSPGSSRRERLLTCHRDLWAGQRPRDGRRGSVRHRLGGERPGGPEPGARVTCFSSSRVVTPVGPETSSPPIGMPGGRRP